MLSGKAGACARASEQGDAGGYGEVDSADKGPVASDRPFEFF